MSIEKKEWGESSSKWYHILLVRRKSMAVSPRSWQRNCRLNHPHQHQLLLILVPVSVYLSRVSGHFLHHHQSEMRWMVFNIYHHLSHQLVKEMDAPLKTIMMKKEQCHPHQ